MSNVRNHGEKKQVRLPQKSRRRRGGKLLGLFLALPVIIIAFFALFPLILIPLTFWLLLRSPQMWSWVQQELEKKESEKARRAILIWVSLSITLASLPIAIVWLQMLVFGGISRVSGEALRNFLGYELLAVCIGLLGELLGEFLLKSRGNTPLSISIGSFSILFLMVSSVELFSSSSLSSLHVARDINDVQLLSFSLILFIFVLLAGVVFKWTVGRVEEKKL